MVYNFWTLTSSLLKFRSKKEREGESKGERERARERLYFCNSLSLIQMPKSVGEEHVVPEHPCVVPDLMREDFVHMAKVSS